MSSKVQYSRHHYMGRIGVVVVDSSDGMQEKGIEVVRATSASVMMTSWGLLEQGQWRCLSPTVGERAYFAAKQQRLAWLMGMAALEAKQGTGQTGEGEE
jgi:hypothetical protein